MVRPKAPEPKIDITISLRKSILDRANDAAENRGLTVEQHIAERIEAAYPALREFK